MAFFEIFRPAGLTRVARVVWTSLQMILAIAIGTWSLRYVLPNPPDVPGLESFNLAHTAFVTHTLSASLALLLGPWQFLQRLRSSRPIVHRYIGRIYAGAIVVAWAASIPIAMNAHTGAVAGAAFLTLGFTWVVATVNGVRLARNREFLRHREWMLRSYALTAAGITLRIYIGLSEVAHLPFDHAYPIIAWMCWVPNLIVVEWMIWRRRSQLPYW